MAYVCVGRETLQGFAGNLVVVPLLGHRRGDGVGERFLVKGLEDDAVLAVDEFGDAADVGPCHGSACTQ